MALNPYFNNFDYQPTQELIQDLLEQVTDIYGHEVLYLPRNLNNYDQLYQTDDQSNYSQSVATAVYIEDIDGFQGDRDIFTKFGLEIRDQINMMMPRRRFEKDIQPITNQPRPMEGDIIYFTLNKKCFQIKYVNNKEMFYPFGVLPSYRLTLNLFEYSDESFNTGIPEIDSMTQNLSLNTIDHSINDADGNNTLIVADGSNNTIISDPYDLQNVEPVADNDDLEKEDISFIDFSANNPLGNIDRNF